MSTFADSKQLYLRLLRYVKPYKARFAIAIASMITLALSQAAFAALLQPLLDKGFNTEDTSAQYLLPLAILGVAVIRGLSTFISTYSMTWVANKVVNDLRNQMFQRLLLIPIPFFDNHPSGKLISKVTYDANQVTLAATTALTIMVRDSVTIVALLGWMIYLNWQLSITALALIPIVALTANIIGKRLRNLSQLMQDMMGNMTHILEETIKGIKIIRIFNGQKQESARFAEAAKSTRQIETKFISAAATNTAVVEFAGAAALAALVFLGANLAKTGDLTPGSFISFITAMGLLFAPIKKLTSVNALVQKGLAASSSIFAIIDQEVEVESKDLADDINHQGQLVFENVDFQYQEKEKLALNAINLTIEAGMTTALVGPSGGGKTTLANLIPRFYEVTKGRILFDGIDIQSLSLLQLRRQISSVGQDTVLFNDSIAANIAYGLEPKPSDDAIRDAAIKAHALEFINQMPQGFDTLVGENGTRLSGGQRQRIAIARALLKNAPILILDEATSALDSSSEKHVQDALTTLEAGRTTIVIAHRLSTIEKADKIVVLDKGEIVELGSHQALMQNNSLYKNLYKTQFKHDQD